MCEKCKKCGSDENEFVEYQYNLEEVKIETKCHNCDYKEIYNYTSPEFKDGYPYCPKCEGEEFKSDEWEYDEENEIFHVFYVCQFCNLEFGVAYELDK